MIQNTIEQTFKEFETNNILYAYIRDENAYKNALCSKVFDIDIIVRSKDLDIIKDILNKNLFFNLFGYKSYYYIDDTIWFDLHYNIYERYPQLNIDKALSKRKYNGLFYRLSENDLFKVLLFHPMDLTGFRGQRLHTKDKQLFLNTSAVNIIRIQKEIEEDFGNFFSDRIINYLKKKDFTSIKKFNLLFKFLIYLKRPEYLKFMFGRLKKKIFGEKGKLVVFVGVDGSGKTTTAENTIEFIKKYFRDEKKEKVKYFYLGSLAAYILPIAKLAEVKNSFKKYIFISKSEIIRKKNNGINVNKNSIIKEIFFLFEYLARYIKLMYMLKLKKQIVVTDRYLYDSFRRDNIDSNSIKLFLDIFPKPDYLFFMKGDTNEFFKRKGEYTPEVLNDHQNDIYNGLKEKNIKFKEIDALMSEDKVLIEVLKTISD